MLIIWWIENINNRAHVKSIVSKIVVSSQNAGDSKLQIGEDENNYKDVKMDLTDHITKSDNINLKAHYLIVRWFGNVDDKSPVLEGIDFEEIIDKGIQNG